MKGNDRDNIYIFHNSVGLQNEIFETDKHNIYDETGKVSSNEDLFFNGSSSENYLFNEKYIENEEINSGGFFEKANKRSYADENVFSGSLSELNVSHYDNTICNATKSTKQTKVDIKEVTTERGILKQENEMKMKKPGDKVEENKTIVKDVLYVNTLDKSNKRSGDNSVSSPNNDSIEMQHTENIKFYINNKESSQTSDNYTEMGKRKTDENFCKNSKLSSSLSSDNATMPKKSKTECAFDADKCTLLSNNDNDLNKADAINSALNPLNTVSNVETEDTNKKKRKQGNSKKNKDGDSGNAKSTHSNSSKDNAKHIGLVDMDEFCFRQFENTQKFCTYVNYDKDKFVEEVNKMIKLGRYTLTDGYASFCKHLFIENFTETTVETIPLEQKIIPYVRSNYFARNKKELPVLVRWVPKKHIPDLPKAKYLDIILYSKEQIEKENEAMNAASKKVKDTNSKNKTTAVATSVEKEKKRKKSNEQEEIKYSIIAIKAQDEQFELPMSPITMMRNACIEEGGSGVKIDRKAYADSVIYWSSHIAVYDIDVDYDFNLADALNLAEINEESESTKEDVNKEEKVIEMEKEKEKREKKEKEKKEEKKAEKTEEKRTEKKEQKRTEKKEEKRTEKKEGKRTEKEEKRTEKKEGSDKQNNKQKNKNNDVTKENDRKKKDMKKK